jgi:neutral trehalase
MNLIEQEIKDQNKLNNQWQYYPLWQEIISISTELNNLGLSLMNLDITEDNLKKVTTVLERSKKVIAKLETKKLT